MIQLYNADCLDVMAQLPTSSVDLVLCDLPYGTTQNKWDAVIPFNQLWRHYTRLVRNGLVVLTAQQPFTTIVVGSNLKAFRYEWVWEKNTATGFMNANKMPLKAHENILIFYDNLPTYNPQFIQGESYTRVGGKTGENYGKVGIKQHKDTISDGKRFPRSVIKYGREVGLHPTQKPVALMEYLVKTYTNPGDTVLDNCMGSGTTGVACVNTGRNFIGIEKDPTYFEICKQRIERAEVAEWTPAPPADTCLSHKEENCKRCNL